MSFHKKHTRKEMLNQPDEFVIGFSHAVQFFQQHGRLLNWLIAGVFLAGALTVAHFVYHGNKNTQAAVLEAEAFRAYQGEPVKVQNDQGQLSAPKGDYKAAQQKYQEIYDKYSGTDNARRALLYLGNCAYKLKEYDKAEKLYQQYLIDYPQQDIWYLEALHSLAYTQEEEGKFSNAADSYQKLASLLEDVKQKQIIYLDLARAYKLSKAWDKAIQVYENMLQTTDDPGQQEIIKSKLTQVKAQAGAAGAAEKGK